MSRVIIHIDTLALTGFSPEDRRGLAAGLRSELSRLFADPAAAARLAATGNLAKVSVGTVGTGQRHGAEAIGRSSARGIVKGIAP